MGYKFVHQRIYGVQLSMPCEKLEMYHIEKNCKYLDNLSVSLFVPTVIYLFFNSKF